MVMFSRTAIWCILVDAVLYTASGATSTRRRGALVVARADRSALVGDERGGSASLAPRRSEKGRPRIGADRSLDNAFRRQRQPEARSLEFFHYFQEAPLL